MSEETFSQYLSRNESSDTVRLEIIGYLTKEGFTEQEVLEMPKDQVWRLYCDCMKKEFEDIFTGIYKSIEVNPKVTQTPAFKALSQQAKEICECLERQIDSLEKVSEKNESEK